MPRRDDHYELLRDAWNAWVDVVAACRSMPALENYHG